MFILKAMQKCQSWLNSLIYSQKVGQNPTKPYICKWRSTRADFVQEHL